MPGNFKKDDLRVEKTLNAIQEALLKLLERRGFGQITVNKLCEEAQISRRTFYSHYNDKYDLLKTYLASISMKIGLIIDDSSHHTWVEKIINQLISENAKIISNLVKDANDETLDLLYEFMLSLLDVPEKKDKDREFSPRYIVLSNFCAGGMMKLLSWQVDTKLPQDLQRIIIKDSINLILHIMTWKSD